MPSINGTDVAARPRPRRARLFTTAMSLVVTSLVASLIAATPTATAQDDLDPATELAERYAPVLRLKSQSEPCDTEGEPYGPISVEAVLDNPQIVLRQVGPGDPVVLVGPSAADLFDLGEGFHLDFPGSALDPGCIYEADNERYTRDLEPTVYARVFEQVGDGRDQVVLQYWFYWYYNDWNNKHESDWEGIALRFEAPTAEAALGVAPAEVGYAQHEGGESSGWDDDKLERDGDRPIVYPSAGSHASYFGSALYLGRSASEGFGCDTTDGPSDEVRPAVVMLPESVSNPDDPLAWLAFEGRWGERQTGPFNGPTGPASKDRWADPIGWFDDLRSKSVAVPAGDQGATGVVNLFCGVIEFGSGIFTAFSSSPATVAIAVVVLGLIVLLVLRRTTWDSVPGLPIAERRAMGQIIRAAGRLYVKNPAIPLTGLIFLPALALAMLVVRLFEAVPFLGALLQVGGGDDPISVVLSLLIGGLPNLFALVMVTGGVAAVLHNLETDGRPRPLHGIVALRHTAGQLARATVRSTLIVTALLISIVGIPWGIRQLVRYQFMPACVQLENRPSREALQRSSDLVEGRWWHTALFVAVMNGVVTLVSSITGLLALVIFTGIPLWLFVAVMNVVSATIIPLGATAVTLLYGDALANDVDEQPTDADELVGAP